MIIYTDYNSALYTYLNNLICDTGLNCVVILIFITIQFFKIVSYICNYLLCRDIDELSDLEENETISNHSNSSESSKEEYFVSNKSKQSKSGKKRKKSFRDVACQTEYSERLPDTSQNTLPSLVPSEIIVAESQTLIELAPSQMSSRKHKEDDDETELFADPRFLVRPNDISVIEGEPLTFHCEVEGSQPAGKQGLLCNLTQKMWEK